MKLDKSAISDSEQDRNAIIESDNIEKSNYRNEVEIVKGLDFCKQNIEQIENVAVELKCLSLDCADKKINNHVSCNEMSKSISNPNLESKKNVDRAMEIIDAELAINPCGKTYSKILTVDLSHEKMSSIEESMCQMLTNLVVLNLSNSNLSNLPDFLNFKSLKQLDISHNKFEFLPVCLQVFNSKIVNLDVSYNNLKTLEQPRCTHTLKKLNISNNIDMKIPEWFWYQEFNTLEELNMSFTDPFFQQLPVWLLNHIDQKERGVFTNLISLNIQNTSAYMDKVSQLKSLKSIKYLNCSNERGLGSSNGNVNVLWELPHCISHLTTVQELHLSSIQLNFIPEDISNLVSLEILNISHNRIVRLPESLANLTSLKVLDVSYNNLIMLPERFGSLPNLTTLHAQCNCLSELPIEFDAMNLIYCDLYNNELAEKCVPVINKMKSLCSLDLMQNYIKQDLLPLHLQENLRTLLTHPEDRATEPKTEYITEADYRTSHYRHIKHGGHDTYSGYSSFCSSSSSRSASPEPTTSCTIPNLEPSVVASNDDDDPNESNWDDEATNSDKFNFCIVGDEWQNHLPKSYDEAIERFRTRRPSDTTFIPGDSQVKYFRRKELRRFDFLSRPVVPGQFDDA